MGGFGQSFGVERSIFENLSPLDHRYYLANKDLFDQLSGYLSEDASVTYAVRVEVAILEAHIAAFFDDDAHLLAAARALPQQVTPKAVYEEEARTHHNIRAIVNLCRDALPRELRPFVHLGATSMDVLDTAAALRFRGVTRGVVVPLAQRLLGELIALGRRELHTPQVGRTHGQHAVPITFGFAVASYVARLGSSLREIRRHASQLRGKLSGAVGAYNATSVVSRDPRSLEQEVLRRLDLEPPDIATQIVPPEPLLRLLSELNAFFGIVANIADDLRHLQRSEIAEVAEAFGTRQVGSSTMPQKRNPWNSEHVKSLWKAFAPRIMTSFMDQISEHQRDLSNSASSRFIADYIAGFVAAVERMRRVVGSLVVDRERMRANLALRGDSILAEPAYLLLALAGEENAHETVREATLKAEHAGGSLRDALSENPEAWNSLSKTLHRITGLDAGEFFSHPEHYLGRAVEAAQEVFDAYEPQSGTDATEGLNRDE